MNIHDSVLLEVVMIDNNYGRNERGLPLPRRTRNKHGMKNAPLTKLILC